MLSDTGMAELVEVMKRYPTKRAAILPLMHIIQREQGYVSAEAEEWIAERLELAPVKVHEVLTFYSMLHQQPVGRYHLQVCRTLSCSLRGAGRLLGYLGQEHDLRDGQVADDGLFSVDEVECLGACGDAPVVQINDDYHREVTVESFGELLDRLRRDSGAAGGDE